MTRDMPKWEWNPGKVISEDFQGHACMVLNRDIRIPPDLAERIWENAYIRCTVDGGTNRWRQFLEKYCQGRSIKPPDYITGDFDSITEETAQYFQHPSIKRVYTPDQSYTDFTKAIGIIMPIMKEKNLKDIVVFHDTSGRFDQIMANVSTLYKMMTTDMNIYMISGNSMTWLLRTGKHSICIPRDLVDEQRWCALIPVSQPTRKVTTTGLKWDLTKSSMSFETLISTSNTYASDEVEVETTHPLVWSMGMFTNEND